MNRQARANWMEKKGLAPLCEFSFVLPYRAARLTVRELFEKWSVTDLLHPDENAVLSDLANAADTDLAREPQADCPWIPEAEEFVLMLRRRVFERVTRDPQGTGKSMKRL